MSIQIPLVNASGDYALVDEADAPAVNRHKWRKSSPRHSRTSYAYTTSGSGKSRELILLHRFILGLKKGDPRYVDHINRTGWDCRRSNLRIVDPSQNAVNKELARTSKSGLKGVCWSNREKKWRAYAAWKGKLHHLGYYEDKDHAGIAYSLAAARLHGEHAVPNPIPTNIPEEILAAIEKRVETHLQKGFRRRRLDAPASKSL